MEAHGDDRDQPDSETLNRQLIELLNELRVAMPGVQVLFGFLLAVPFAQRFTGITSFEKNVYFVTLICTAIASAALIAPASYHRLMFQHRDKPHLIAFGTRLLIVGLVFMALAMNGVILLVTHLLFGAATAYVATAVVGLVFLWLWFGVALVRRARGHRSH